jgi:hypothetical protein
MIDRKKRLVITGFIALALVGVLPSVTQAKTFKEWFCGLLGINPKVYDKLTRTRGPDDPIPGARLMKLNLETGNEEVVWNCIGCWSPVMVNSTDIAVLKKDAATGQSQIWILPAAKATGQHQVFAGAGIDMLVGLANKPNKLLLLQKNADCKKSSEGDEFSIREIDLGFPGSKLEKPADLPQQCVSLIDAVPKPDQIRNQILLSNSAKLDINSGQRKRRELTKLPVNDKYFAPLAPQLDEQFERYDPIWLSDREVIYILNPWSSP